MTGARRYEQRKTDRQTIVKRRTEKKQTDQTYREVEEEAE